MMKKNLFLLIMAFVVAFPLGAISQEKEKKKNEALLFAEKMPEFPGGNEEMMKFLNENLKYPEKASKDTIQGKVYVEFIVKSTGAISDVRVSRSAGKLLDDEALRVVKLMPKWTPGEQDGQKVDVSYMLPIAFIIK